MGRKYEAGKYAAVKFLGKGDRIESDRIRRA